MISAIFDACVLYSGSLRDFFLHLADDGLIVPYWTEEIQNEWVYNLLQNRLDLKRENLERTCHEMDFHFPDARVYGIETDVLLPQLPDSKDRHVLAAAIRAKAEYIVTFNLKDFPTSALAPYQVEAISPDDFTLRIIEYATKTFLTTIAKHRSDLINPPKTVEQYLATLEQQKLLKTVAFLREHKDKI